MSLDKIRIFSQEEKELRREKVAIMQALRDSGEPRTPEELAIAKKREDRIEEIESLISAEKQKSISAKETPVLEDVVAESQSPAQWSAWRSLKHHFIAAVIVFFGGFILVGLVPFDDGGYVVLSEILLIIFVMMPYGLNLYSHGKERIRAAREKEYLPILNQARSVIRSSIDEHIFTLRQKYRRCEDDYGGVKWEKWFKEEDYFFDNHILIMLKARNVRIAAAAARMLFNEELREKLHTSGSIQDKEVDLMTGEEFEEYCSSRLEMAGWEAKLTKKSGDQGVDIIAKKNGKILAIQCKRYSSSVGNKAIQEIAAGVQYVGAHYGVVITNSSYTKSAIELARSTGISLLHYLDIAEIDRVAGF